MTLAEAPLHVAVVGATGMVGREFLEILEERKYPVAGLKLFASAESQGQTIGFRGKQYRLDVLQPGCFEGVRVAFFCSSGDISKKWAPQAVKEGAFVVDKSSAFRMSAEVPLIVPEVNGHLLPSPHKPTIIANPNCSTIQLVVALKPLHDHFKLASVEVATYQSVSGAGKEAVEELSSQTRGLLNGKEPAPKVFPHPIAFNNIPHIDSFDDSGFTGEELKMMKETQKILDLPDLPLTATCVRTPTFNGHSEAAWVTLEKEVDRQTFLKTLAAAPGVEVLDDPSNNSYPLNREATKQDMVYVGRIRRDPYNAKRWLMWIVSDNIRKGAALNGLQIAEKLFDLK